MHVILGGVEADHQAAAACGGWSVRSRVISHRLCPRTLQATARWRFVKPLDLRRLPRRWARMAMRPSVEARRRCNRTNFGRSCAA